VLIAVAASALCARDGATRAEWTDYEVTYRAWRYSALDQIQRGNVKKLTTAWVFQAGVYENGLQSTPIALDGVLYLSTSNSWAFAVDGATGKALWEYRFPLSKAVPLYGKQNRGVAVGRGRVFLGTADNHIVALDQRSGAE